MATFKLQQRYGSGPECICTRDRFVVHILLVKKHDCLVQERRTNVMEVSGLRDRRMEAFVRTRDARDEEGVDAIDSSHNGNLQGASPSLWGANCWLLIAGEHRHNKQKKSTKHCEGASVWAQLNYCTLRRVVELMM